MQKILFQPKDQKKGLVHEILVNINQEVEEGQIIAIILSRSSEYKIVSPIKGIISKISVTENQIIDPDSLLLEISSFPQNSTWNKAKYNAIDPTSDNLSETKMYRQSKVEEILNGHNYYDNYEKNARKEQYNNDATKSVYESSSESYNQSKPPEEDSKPEIKNHNIDYFKEDNSSKDSFFDIPGTENTSDIRELVNSFSLDDSADNKVQANNSVDNHAQVDNQSQVDNSKPEDSSIGNVYEQTDAFSNEKQTTNEIDDFFLDSNKNNESSANIESEIIEDRSEPLLKSLNNKIKYNIEDDNLDNNKEEDSSEFVELSQKFMNKEDANEQHSFRYEEDFTFVNLKESMIQKILYLNKPSYFGSVNTIDVEVDVSELTNLLSIMRKSYLDKGFELNLNTYYTKAIVDTLKKFPIMNASIDMKSLKIKLWKTFNICLSIDTDRGVRYPVLNLDLDSSISKIAELIQEAKETSESTNIIGDRSTFSIQNFGEFGISKSSLNIPHNHVASFCANVILKKPVVVDEEEIAIRDIITISLSYNDIVIDLATASMFLHYVAYLLSNPGLII